MLKLNLGIFRHENIKGNLINYMKSLRAFVAFEVNVLLDVQAKPGMNRC